MRRSLLPILNMFLVTTLVAGFDSGCIKKVGIEPGDDSLIPPPWGRDWVINSCGGDNLPAEPNPNRPKLCPYCADLDDEYLCFANPQLTNCEVCAPRETNGTSPCCPIEPSGLSWRPCNAHVITVDDPWLSHAQLVTTPLFDGNEVMVITPSRVSPTCQTWNKTFPEYRYTIHIVRPPSNIAELAGGIPRNMGPDGLVPKLQELFNSCRSDSSIGKVAQTSEGFTVDLSRTYNQREHVTYDGSNCDLDPTIEDGVLVAPDGAVQPLRYNFPPPEPYLGRAPSPVFPACPSCDDVDARWATAPDQNPLRRRFDLGYFPVELVDAYEWDDLESQGSIALSDLGIPPLNASNASLCLIGSYDPTWLCDHGDYAILVGKWMAPFCEGWGLPRGIMIHEVNLTTGEVRLRSWAPFTETYYNLPWRFDGLRTTIKGVTVEVMSAEPEGCAVRVPAGLTIAKPDGIQLSVDLPLRP